MDGGLSARRFLHYAFYNSTREMLPARRAATMPGLILHGYAFHALLTRSLVWPIIWPSGPRLYAVAWILFTLCYFALLR